MSEQADGDTIYNIRYPMLAMFFMDLPDTTDQITVTIGALESLAGESLPPEALFEEWWISQDIDRQAAWAIAGWRIDFVVAGQAVGFSRATPPPQG
jgi:hypothetical protein